MCSNSAFDEIHFEITRRSAHKIDANAITSLGRDECMCFENAYSGSQTDKSVVGIKLKNEIDMETDKNGVINQREITLMTNRI